MINSIADSVTDNFIVDEIHALCYLSSKDGCDWTFYLQHPTPVSFRVCVAYLTKDSTLNDLCGKTLGTCMLSFCSVTKKR